MTNFEPFFCPVDECAYEADSWDSMAYHLKSTHKWTAQQIAEEEPI